MDLPIPEEIYDLDSFSLRELVGNLHKNIEKVQNVEIKEPNEQTFLKKAKKILTMAELELEERGTVEKFGEFCIENEENFLTYFELNINPYSKSNTFCPKSESLTKERCSFEKGQEDKLSLDQNGDKISSGSRPIEDSSQKGGQKNISFSQFSTNSESMKSEIASSEEERYLLKMKQAKLISKGAKKKQTSMYDFMKETLQNTRQNENKLVIGKGTVGKYERRSVERQDKSYDNSSDTSTYSDKKEPIAKGGGSLKKGREEFSKKPRSGFTLAETEKKAAEANAKSILNSTRTKETFVLAKASGTETRRKSEVVTGVKKKKRKKEENEDEDEEEAEKGTGKKKIRKPLEKVNGIKASSSTKAKEKIKLNPLSENEKKKKPTSADKIIEKSKPSSSEVEATVKGKVNEEIFNSTEKSTEKSIDTFSKEVIKSIVSPRHKATSSLSECEDIPEKIEIVEGSLHSDKGEGEFINLNEEIKEEIHYESASGDNPSTKYSNEMKLKGTNNNLDLSDISEGEEGGESSGENKFGEDYYKRDNSEPDERDCFEENEFNNPYKREGNSYRSGRTSKTVKIDRIGSEEKLETSGVSNHPPIKRPESGSQYRELANLTPDKGDIEKFNERINKIQESLDVLKKDPNVQVKLGLYNTVVTYNLEKEKSERPDSYPSSRDGRTGASSLNESQSAKPSIIMPENPEKPPLLEQNNSLDHNTSLNNEKLEKTQQIQLNTSKPNLKQDPSHNQSKPSTSGSHRQGSAQENKKDSALSSNGFSEEEVKEEGRKPSMIKQIFKKKAPPKPKLPKLTYELADSDVLDYSSWFSTFPSIFSGFYNNFNPNATPQIQQQQLQNIDILNIMREIFGIFVQHVQKVDEVDRVLAKYKPSIAPLELNANELLFLNDPKNIFIYARKTNIDVNSYIERQNIFNSKLKGTFEEDPTVPPLYYRVVKNKPEVYDIVSRSFLRKKNWVELPHGLNLKTSWNLLWTWSKAQIDMNKLLFWQKVNHFPLNKNIVRKDLLKKNIERAQKLGPKAAQAFNIIPLTFVLPKEYVQFMEHFYKETDPTGTIRGKSTNYWILKPVGKSRGRGISLINDISQVIYSEQVIVQKYLKNPLLIRGYKFDMRIYVLVTSMNPLEVFLYKEGFARMSTEQFSLDPEDMNKLFIHLTNVAIQKNNTNQCKNNTDVIVGGSKLSLKILKERLEERGYSFHRIWMQVIDIILKSLIACQGEIPSNPNCFELFGYDIIVDDNEKCWLLEVNSSPSLARDTILDDLVKQQLVDDIIDLVDPLNFDRSRLIEVLERRIREEQGCKSTINTHNHSKVMLNRDLTYILKGKMPRKVGEKPNFIGNFERIAPSETSDKLIKLVQSYKVANPRLAGAFDS